MRACGLIPLLLLLVLLSASTPGSAVTLRSGKALGPDVAAQQPPLQQQAQQWVEDVLPAGLATTTGNLVHDVGLFLAQHVLGLVGWGAMAGSVYRAVNWVTSTDCYKAGTAAAKPSAAYVTGWERHFWSAAGGVGTCIERLWKDAPVVVHRNPHFSELADLHTLDGNLWITVVLIAAFLALARLLLKGPPDRAALRGAAIWFIAAAVGLTLGAQKARSSKLYMGLEKVCEDWLGQPTERQWLQYKLWRAGLKLADAGSHTALCSGLVCGLASVAQAVWGYLRGTKAEQEALTEVQEQEPPPSPTPPPSLKRLIPEEEGEEEPPSRSTGARSGGGGGAEGYEEHPFRSEEVEGAGTSGRRMSPEHQRRTIPVTTATTTTTTTAMVVFTPTTPPALPLKKGALELPLTKRRTSPMGKGGRVIEVISLGGGVVKWRYADNLPDLIVGLPPLPDDEWGLVACGAGSLEQEGMQGENE